MKLHKIYFSAAGTTKRIVEAIATGVTSSVEVEEVDYPLIKMAQEPVSVAHDDIAIFAVPVYAGRVPDIAVEQIRRFRGDKTRAILVVVYGNRAADDALLELRNIVKECGFVAVSAGAFVAEHCIFPKVAANRPNAEDLSTAQAFGEKSALIPVTTTELRVPGNYPYKIPGSIPIAPRTKKSKCIKAVKKDMDLCGICVKLCPVGAIGSPKPKTDKDLCIKCAHCIAVCPHDAREWGGLLYKIVEHKFVGSYSTPKEAELYYLEN